MSGRGQRGRGRPPLAVRGRGRASSLVASTPAATIPTPPVGDHSPPLPEPLGPPGSEARLIAAPSPPVLPTAPPATPAPVSPPPGDDYQRLEAMVKHIMQQQQQVLPPAGADAHEIQPAVQA